MYFDFFSENGWAYPSRMSVKTVYKQYSDPSYDIHHRIIDREKYILLYTLDGNGLIQVDDQEFHVQANHLVFTNAQHSLAYRCEGESWNFWLFEFKTDRFFLKANHLYTIPFKTGYFSICDAILSSLKREKQELSSAYFTLMVYLLAEEIAKETETGKHSSILDKSVEYMKENIKSFSVTALSQFLNVPVRTLVYQFDKETGASPTQYFQRIRIEMGKELLENTSMSIADIAEQLGFCNSGHFATVFKQYCSISPTKYRREFYISNLE